MATLLHRLVSVMAVVRLRTLLPCVFYHSQKTICLNNFLQINFPFTKRGTQRRYSNDNSELKNPAREKLIAYAQNREKVARPTINITFISSSGDPITVLGKIGDNLLDVVVNNELNFDGFGVCEGTLSCSTCHLIFKEEDFKRLPEKITDDELDMLDLARSTTSTSRLGCQIYLTKEMDGLVVRLPDEVHDIRT